DTDSLAVRWSHGARTSVGVVGGCAANIDLSFPNLRGISKYYFAITFDNKNRPIVRDLGSKGGTKVTYDREHGQRLSSFDWPLEGPSIANGKPPILNITDLVQFKVILPDHDYASPEYIDKKHIVAFRGATFSLYPRLKFEYVPGGSLDKYTKLSMFESTQVVYQISSALEYLHNRNPSIGHRDIKPENILVERRGADGICVKFADFGLSKAADVLKTCCGTLLYTALEIYLKLVDPVGAAKDTYGVSVDIWTLGVVIASLVCGLPVYKEEWKTDAVNWIHAVQARVNDYYIKHGGELLYLLLDGMLVEDPDERSSVDYVTVEALKILKSMENESDDEGSVTPTPSIVGARSVVESESLNENSKSDDVVETVEGWEWVDVPDPEIQLRSQVVDTIEALPQGSTVDGLLWNAVDPERASFASTTSSDGSTATELGTVEAPTEHPQEEEYDALFIARWLPGDEGPGDGAREAVEAPGVSQSTRKRSWLEGKSPLSLPRSFTHPPSADQRRAISREQPDHKRSRLEGRMAKDLSGEPRP
ncbi:MAG: hypothetical protein Q9173_005748, partial [Seirophora scorigena]